jgi:hypothetical protein
VSSYSLDEFVIILQRKQNGEGKPAKFSKMPKPAKELKLPRPRKEAKPKERKGPKPKPVQQPRERKPRAPRDPQLAKQRERPKKGSVRRSESNTSSVIGEDYVDGHAGFSMLEGGCFLDVGENGYLVRASRPSTDS